MHPFPIDVGRAAVGNTWYRGESRDPLGQGHLLGRRDSGVKRPTRTQGGLGPTVLVQYTSLHSEPTNPHPSFPLQLRCRNKRLDLAQVGVQCRKPMQFYGPQGFTKDFAPQM